MTPEEMERTIERLTDARRDDERKIATLEGELRTEKAKRGTAEKLRDETAAQARTDRARTDLVARFVTLGVRSDAARYAADDILANGDPEFDAEGNLGAAIVHGVRCSDVGKMAARELEKSAWLHRAVGLPEETSAEPGGTKTRAGKAGLEGIDGGGDKNLLTMNMKDMTDRVQKRIQAGSHDPLPPPARRMTEDELTFAGLVVILRPVVA